MEKDLINENPAETETAEEYIEAIQTLKANTVDKAKYDALRLENKKLLDSIVNGQEYNEQVQKEQEVDINELRKKTFDNENQTDLEYVTNVLELRNELLKRGETDPFVPQGLKVSATQADYERAERVANALQEMVDFAEGDPQVFLKMCQKIR